MIKYFIKHHIKGRIRVEIPDLRRISFSRLKGLNNIEVPEGIKEIKPNPFSGTVVITYEPSKIDIEAYLQKLSTDERITTLFDKNRA